jgi:hypothetical protein
MFSYSDYLVSRRYCQLKIGSSKNGSQCYICSTDTQGYTRFQGATSIPNVNAPQIARSVGISKKMLFKLGKM